MQKIIVVGAGINGLAAAKRLREVGHNVTVAAETFSPHTVSNAAAAVWKPYSSEQSERAGLWAKVTLNALMRQANDPTSGVTSLWVNQIDQATLPWWSEFVPEEITQIDLTKAIIEGKEVANCRYRSVVADMSIYMPWLMKQCEQAGIQFIKQSVNNLEEVLENYDAAVICTGGNKMLCPNDTKLRPLTGVVLVYPGRLTDECWSMYNKDDPSAPTYINPRNETTIVGGTALLSETELTPEFLEKTKNDIYRRAVKLLPSLPEPDDSCKIIHAARPHRLPTVRLEKTKLGGKPVIYNYGHGGAGVTFSWGCATEVSILLANNLDLGISLQQGIPLPNMVAAGEPKPIRRRMIGRVKDGMLVGWEAVKSSPISPMAALKRAKDAYSRPTAPPPGLMGQS